MQHDMALPPHEDSSGLPRAFEQEWTAFLEAVKAHALREIPLQFDRDARLSFSSQIDESKLCVIGETHGVKENVDIIYTLFHHFGFRRLALEWPSELHAPLLRFFDTGEIDYAAIQDSPDGRITAGHYALLAKLKAEGLLDDVVCFDSTTETSSWDERDMIMAQHILMNLTDTPMLTMTGNAHSKTEAFTFEHRLHHPMGEIIHHELPPVPFVTIAYHTGTYYNFGIHEFTSTATSPADSGYRCYRASEGNYVVELPVAHAATVPNTTERLPDTAG